MSDVQKFVAEWNDMSAKDGFERYVEEQKDEAAEKAERKSLLETAKNMLNDNVEISVIEKYTGLSKIELNKLKKEIC